LAGISTLRLIVISPVFNDWDSFSILVSELSRQFAGTDLELHILAVDDGSSQTFDLNALILPTNNCIRDIKVVHLATNLGHQRAIAVGLTEVPESNNNDLVIIMDSDGEDRPSDICSLLSAAQRYPGSIIFASRIRRSEGFVFRIGYIIYKLVFRLLTGHTIAFGNFCLIPMTLARRLAHRSEVWNNLASAIIRSRLRYQVVPIARGQRYAGISKMNLISLIAHGLSAMSVSADLIFVRILIGCSLFSGFLMGGIALAVLIRFATDLAIPGWATTVVGLLSVMLMQTIVLIVATTLMQLSGRNSRPMIPATDCSGFIERRQFRTFPTAQTQPVAGEAIENE
jgi:polyisoprenyl-phosphate glycosyltransferase